MLGCVSRQYHSRSDCVRENVFNSFDVFYIVFSKILLGFLVAKYTITHEPYYEPKYFCMCEINVSRRAHSHERTQTYMGDNDDDDDGIIYNNLFFVSFSVQILMPYKDRRAHIS